MNPTFLLRGGGQRAQRLPPLAGIGWWGGGGGGLGAGGLSAWVCGDRGMCAAEEYRHCVSLEGVKGRE